MNIDNGTDSKPLTLRHTGNKTNYVQVNNEVRKAIADEIDDLMGKAPKFAPGLLNGKPVVATYHCFRFINHFKVENGRIFDSNEKGEWTEL